MDAVEVIEGRAEVCLLRNLIWEWRGERRGGRGGRRCDDRDEMAARKTGVYNKSNGRDEITVGNQEAKHTNVSTKREE